MSASVSAVWLLYLCCYLPTLIGGAVGQEHGSGNAKVVVEEGTDAVLRCMISTKEDIAAKIFDWKKDGQKEVFLYAAGSNDANRGQDEQFKGRVSHFQDQLMNGNASIKIQNTKVTDSGTYSCIFPHLHSQTFNIELVVGASPRPYITILKAAQDGQLLLQCEVLGASPKPEVQWLDSAGNPLSAEEPRVTERENHFYITVLTTVTKTDNFRCVATQKEIGHQTFAETYVPFSEAAPAPKPYVITLDQTKDWSLLQCEVEGASPKPKVEWQDSAGNILSVKQHVSERGGRYYVTLNTTVTRTDHYRCVVTQEEISHHIYAETHVFISGNSSSKEAIGLLFGVFVLGAAVLAVVLTGLVATKYITIIFNKGPRHLGTQYKPPADTGSPSPA